MQNIVLKLSKVINGFSTKSLFSNISLMSQKVCFGQVIQNKMYLKIPPQLLAKAYLFGAVQYDYSFESRSMNKDYYHFNEKLLDNLDFIEFLLELVRINIENIDLANKTFMHIRNLTNMNINYEFLLRKIGVNSLFDLTKYQAIGCFILAIEKGLTDDFEFLVKLDGAIKSRHHLTYSDSERSELLKNLNQTLKRCKMKDFR